MGRIIAKFVWACDVLYRWSSRNKAPSWIAEFINLGKPERLIELGKAEAFRQHLPRVIRPDLILAEDGFWITEIDSVPGGIGLLDWLQFHYVKAGLAQDRSVIGGALGMREGFAKVFPNGKPLVIVVSEESRMYRPEMEWIASQLPFKAIVVDGYLDVPEEYLNVYRFFELFDLEAVPCSWQLFEDCLVGKKWVTPPPKAYLEEKAWFAMLWNPHLSRLWEGLLGRLYYEWLLQHVPRSWILVPGHIPPYAAIPGLELASWDELIQRPELRRRLILKRSGFHPTAWGSRSVVVGCDVNKEEWAQAVGQALDSFSTGLTVLQEFKRPALFSYRKADLCNDVIVETQGRVRLCPYYFVTTTGEFPQVVLGGVLATICPADKKVIHGMSEAVMAPCEGD